MISQVLSASEFGHSRVTRFCPSYKKNWFLLFLQEELVLLEPSCKQTSSLKFLLIFELAVLVVGQRELLVDFHCFSFSLLKRWEDGVCAVGCYALVFAVLASQPVR